MAMPFDWRNFSTVHCRDGKTRRFESGSFPLAHGIPGRVGLLRGYGNAIVPQVASKFISAFVECCNDKVSDGGPVASDCNRDAIPPFAALTG